MADDNYNLLVYFILMMDMMASVNNCLVLVWDQLIIYLNVIVRVIKT